MKLGLTCGIVWFFNISSAKILISLILDKIDLQTKDSDASLPLKPPKLRNSVWVNWSLWFLLFNFLRIQFISSLPMVHSHIYIADVTLLKWSHIRNPVTNHLGHRITFLSTSCIQGGQWGFTKYWPPKTKTNISMIYLIHWRATGLGELIVVEWRGVAVSGKHTLKYHIAMISNAIPKNQQFPHIQGAKKN